METLAKVPDRATAADIQLAADLAKKAATDLDDLVKAQPAGCLCRLIENDNYSYLDYHEACIHHRQYWHLREKLKADYAALEKTLKDETRMRLVVAALTGTAGIPANEDDRGGDQLVLRAIDIANETLRRIAEPT